jgi:uncharacterized membrane protein
MDSTKIIIAGVAVAISGVAASFVVRNRKERPFFYALVAAGTFLALNALSLAFVLPAVRGWQLEAQTRAETKDWHTYAIGDSGLSLSLPGPLEPQQIDVPRDIREVTSKMSVYRYDANGISIGVTAVAYAPGVTANLDGAINGALTNISRQAGDVRLTHSRNSVEIDGRSGAVVDFQIRGGRESTNGRGLFLTEANHAWIVVVAYVSDHALGPSFASRVIGSTSFDR